MPEMLSLMRQMDKFEEASLRRVHNHLSSLFLRDGLFSSALPVEGIARCFDHERNSPGIIIFTRQQVDGFEAILDEIYTPERRPGISIRQGVSGRFLAAAQGGDSIGEGVSGGATGTFGCMVEDAGGQRFMLSCNHVIAGINARTCRLDEVWSPGSNDGGSSTDRVGILHDYRTLALDGKTINTFDAALAEPDSAAAISNSVHTIGNLAGSYAISSVDPLPLPVKKYGNSSQYTTGNILFQLNFKNTYANGSVGVFYDQLGIVGDVGEFAKQGDSGAVVVEDSNLVVGMIVAVSEGIDLAIASPIEPILGHFGVSIAT
jgi:hypothetical protein